MVYLMNRFERRICAVVSLGLSAVGCGAEDSSQGSTGEPRDPDAVVIGTADGVFTSAAELGARDDRPDPTVQGIAEEIVNLNSFSRGASKFEFQEVHHTDGASSLLIVETAPANQSELLTHRLREEWGQLTALETFYALAPHEAAPHERLVAHHSEETAVLRRGDASVRSVDFDAEQPVEKSTSSCWDGLLATNEPWVYAGMRFNRSGNVSVCAGEQFSCNDYVTNTQVDMTWCNETSASMTRAWAIGRASVNNGAWGSEFTSTLAAGTVMRMGVVPQSDSRRYYMRGNSSGPNYHLGFLIHTPE